MASASDMELEWNQAAMQTQEQGWSEHELSCLPAISKDRGILLQLPGMLTGASRMLTGAQVLGAMQLTSEGAQPTCTGLEGI